MLRSEAKPASIIPKANLIGAFHQPRLVLIDPQVLNTLPVRGVSCWNGRVIKYGVIWDADLFAQMEQCGLDQLRYLESVILSVPAKPKLMSSAKMKRSRAPGNFNYGHTIGHAVESLTGYRLFNHGEAVAIGMVAAGQLVVELILG